MLKKLAKLVDDEWAVDIWTSKEGIITVVLTDHWPFRECIGRGKTFRKALKRALNGV